jgi:hypothetical protein
LLLVNKLQTPALLAEFLKPNFLPAFTQRDLDHMPSRKTSPAISLGCPLGNQSPASTQVIHWLQRAHPQAHACYCRISGSDLERSQAQCSVSAISPASQVAPQRRSGLRAKYEDLVFFPRI